MNDIVPIDMAAEATLVQTNSKVTGKQSRSLSDKISEMSDEEDVRETDLWLTKVASMLGAGLSSRAQKTDAFGGKTPRSGQSQEGETASNCSSVPSSEDMGPPQPPCVLNPRTSSPSSSVSFDCLIPLTDIKRGMRHGIRVFQLNDPNRLVGEVILEHANGYAEVAIKGSLVKDRVGSFVVAPDDCNVGDQASTSIPLPPRLIKLMNKNGSPKQINETSRASTGIGTGCTRDDKERQPPLRGASSPAKRYKFSDSPGCLPGKAVKDSPEKVNPLPTDESKLSLESLFYWCCERCTMTNHYLRTRCTACQKRISAASKRSVLLEIASAAVAAAQSEDEVEHMIPFEHNGAIPNVVLSQLFAAKSRGNADSSPKCSDAVTDMDSYFYWICSLCTRRNSYKRLRCESCEVTGRSQSTPSALLEIALDAAQGAQTTEEGMASIPYEHKPSIPESVLASLVTCVAMAGRKPNQRRCLKSRLPGMDYCATHCEPMALPSKGVEGKQMDDDVKPMASPLLHEITEPRASMELAVGSSHSALHASSSIENRGAITIIDNTPMFFSVAGAKSLVNRTNWCVQSIEDAILCQETRPFPLGLSVRRFFPGYGFHDGRIIKVLRQHIRENGVHRPVLVYRVLYNDGDNEDLMHHEINSLCQFYDRCNIEPTAHPLLQLVPGTMFETQKQGHIKIEKHSTPAHIFNGEEGGIAHVKFCKIGQPWKELKVELTQVQLNVVRKLQQHESITIGPMDATSVVDDEEMPEFDKSLAMVRTDPELEGLVSSRTVLIRAEEPKGAITPVLEWPGFSADNSGLVDTRIENECNSSESDGKDDSMISPDLWLSRSRRAEKSKSFKMSSFLMEDAVEEDFCVIDDDSCVRHDVNGCQNGWDPAHALDFLSWDPFRTVVCEVCKTGTNERQILICDQCHLGFHMYCVRPVIVNVPTSEWICSSCAGGNSAGQTFSTLLEELKGNVTEVSHYLNLPFDDPLEFNAAHKDALDLFSPKTHPTKRQAILGVARSKPTAKVGSLFLSCNIHKNDWVIPLPLSAPDIYTKSLASMVAAMKYCGMQRYSEDLIYNESIGVTEDMNNDLLDCVEPLSQRNLDIFNEYKANVKKGAFPPICIVHDEKVGFSVEALAVIPRHTLVSEYVGEVTTVERSGETSSDSLMMLLDTGDPKTSLLVDPTRAGNIARFLSGINNRSHVSRRKANVRTRRFTLNGKCRVALFTSKKIEPGDKLHYDYNAGVEGKTVVEWAKTGFYDTSNFF
uniref:Histone-lysine N-methyltransferase n=2 Tax=Pseudictyota dubia TaxID=2749911 RepID=A0A7R9VLI6_9STRA|mmetsp:Transcript_17873/g.33233  ORF Transcript_17873/g.33233 Transcript_17873/m.33233 type:complete len:1252 (+) Transcript_17873:381-4136(+)